MSLNEIEEKQKVEDITTTTFSIQGVSIKLFKRFLIFCEDNAQATKVYKNDYGQKQIRKELIYSIALAKLLDSYDINIKLVERINKLENEVFKNGNK